MIRDAKSVQLSRRSVSLFISSKRLFSSSERYAVFLGLILLLSSNKPVTYLTYLFLVTSSLRDTGNMNGHTLWLIGFHYRFQRVASRVPPWHYVISHVTQRVIIAHNARIILSFAIISLSQHEIDLNLFSSTSSLPSSSTSSFSLLSPQYRQ